MGVGEHGEGVADREVDLIARTGKNSSKLCVRNAEERPQKSTLEIYTCIFIALVCVASRVYA